MKSVWLTKNIWFAPEGTTVEVETKSYTHDFRVMIQQLCEELKKPEPTTVKVCIREYTDFKKWAIEMEPDYDRYTYDCVDLLVRGGKLPAESLQDYDTPELWKKIRKITGGETRLYELGLREYVNKLALTILCGEAPPLIASAAHLCRCGETEVCGPVDGRHRTLAATSLGLVCVPVIELA